jgi:hypothetical protein
MLKFKYTVLELEKIVSRFVLDTIYTLLFSFLYTPTLLPVLLGNPPPRA